MPVVGYLSTRGPDDDPYILASIRQGLKDVGFIERRNVAIDRFAENPNDRLPALAGPAPTPAALAARAATSTIPIVFEIGANPVAIGLVASLNRPGGNVTGVSNLALEIVPKRLELLRELRAAPHGSGSARAPHICDGSAFAGPS